MKTNKTKTRKVVTYNIFEELTIREDLASNLNSAQFDTRVYVTNGSSRGLYDLNEAKVNLKKTNNPRVISDLTKLAVPFEYHENSTREINYAVPKARPQLGLEGKYKEDWVEHELTRHLPFYAHDLPFEESQPSNPALVSPSGFRDIKFLIVRKKIPAKELEILVQKIRGGKI